MQVIGVAGPSGSGKTTLLVRLIPELVHRGYRVSTMKHARRDFDIDQPGKDTFRHRQAGATEVLIASARRWALMHERRGEPEPDVAELTRQMAPVDLLIIEGFGRGSHDKLELHRRDAGQPLIHPHDRHVVAVLSGEPLPDCSLPVVDLGDIDAVADFIVAHCRRALTRHPIRLRNEVEQK
ncbi:MAG: molybdopterin-guanine dinucleotide biosynthesis protein B [Rhodospirillales bacterium]|nr:molybdopterin-guanine dinucleotide biosynthesis protein B [Rhodospirillales bacterium]